MGIDMKPIEPNCKAMMINSRAGNNGLIVTPIKYLGNAFNYPFNDMWLLAEKIPAITALTGEKGEAAYAGECQLMRIDSDGKDEELYTTTKIKERI